MSVKKVVRTIKSMSTKTIRKIRKKPLLMEDFATGETKKIEIGNKTFDNMLIVDDVLLYKNEDDACSHLVLKIEKRNG